MDSLTIYALTWNTNGRIPPSNMDCLTLLNLPKEACEKGNQLPDIFVLGFQELNLRIDNYVYDYFLCGEDPWTSACRNAMIPHGYIKLKSLRLVGMSISVFVKKQHLLHVRNVETQYTRLGIMSSGLKGAVSMRLNLYGVSFCFINSHLSAHDHMLETRIAEYNSIIENHVYKHPDTCNILYHDYIIWVGDLNFRLKEKTLTHDEIVVAVENGELARLLAMDQLIVARRDGLAFHELTEKLPTFPPTYKFVVGTQSYDEKRRPAWTDRILFRANTFNHESLNVELSMDVSDYKSHTQESFRCSDHQPVSQHFAVSVFGAKLAKAKHVDAYEPMIKFKSLLNVIWYVNEDAEFSYELEHGAGRFVSSWDWIGLYKRDFSSLEDYVGYCWASPCRRTCEPKKCIMGNHVVTLPGTYVLLYITTQGSVMGKSEPFATEYRLATDAVEVAQEALLSDE